MPKQNSTGGKDRLGSISKAGNRYLRQLLVVGALSVIRRAKQLGYTRHPWLVRLMARRSVKVAAIALANKIARIAWAMMAAQQQTFCSIEVNAVVGLAAQLVLPLYQRLILALAYVPRSAGRRTRPVGLLTQ